MRDLQKTQGEKGVTKCGFALFERPLKKLGLPVSWQDPQRLLTHNHYLSLWLFGLLNPVVETMRGLCAASHLARVQQQVCERPVSLGSFSEAQHVLNHALLEKVFNDLASQVQGRGGSVELAGRPWQILDSTLWEALPRMKWARWRTQGTRQQAVRLHLGFHLLDDKPLRAHVTAGRVCERAAWRQQWEAGAAYVGDRNYGEDYRLFDQLEAKHCHFVLRLRKNAVINIIEELPVSETDRGAGVLRQGWVQLGCRARDRPGRLRVVWVQGAEETLVLVTNQTPAELSGDLVSLLYRQRWQVELFFRWIKCILGNRHWLAESPTGVAAQVYLALIAALLLQLYTGRRPGKRMMELIRFYLMGWADEEDVVAAVAKAAAKKRVTKKPV